MTKTIYDWAKEYCGDPASHVTRGELILEFLKEEGLEPCHRVLDLGCGALSQGVPIIRYLRERKYVGVDPNGWLILAALERHPDLESRVPIFAHNADFTALGQDPFDFVVAHSVLSHVAYWQMQLALSNARKHVAEGAVWIASLILDQYNSYDTEWQYPGVSKFRLKTLMTLGYHTGWTVEIRNDLRDRMVAVCPNDTHSWVKLTAIGDPTKMNALRLQEEEALLKAREEAEQTKIEYEKKMKEEEAGLNV